MIIYSILLKIIVMLYFLMGILNINLNIINPDNNFDEDDSDTIIFIRLLAW